jgi:hypothetical protein
MQEKIKADNYNYTRDIQTKHILFFTDKLKKYNLCSSCNFGIFIKGDTKNWSEIKRDVALIYDFLEEKCDKINIVYDGDSSFQILCNPEKGIGLKKFEDLLDNKFSNASKLNYKILNTSDFIKNYQVNKTTGLSSLLIDRDSLMSFKKNDSTLDNIFKKKLNKKFNWDIKEGTNMSKKVSSTKVVQDYYKFVHDQLQGIIDSPEKSFKEEDRQEDNFYRQLQKLKKKSSQPLVSNPPYRGNLLEYIYDNLDESLKDEKSQNKLANVLDEAILILEYLGGRNE